MKILVINPPRTGSTSLVYALSQTLNIKHTNIPDSYTFEENGHLLDKLLTKEDIILRTGPSYNVGCSMEEFSSKFDYTLLLSRRNVEDHYISFVNLYYKYFIVKSNFHDAYDTAEIPTEYFDKVRDSDGWNILLKDKGRIENLSKHLNVPVLYYEDLYFSKVGLYTIKSIIPSLEIETFKHNLNTTKRIKVKKAKTIL